MSLFFGNCMTNQLVVAAGGVGSRMGSSLNGKESKVLIEYDGNPFLWYVLSWAKQSGIGKFFISVNQRNLKTIGNIASKLGIDFTLSMTGPGFKGVPLLFEKYLDERFMVICGHHPVPPEHLKKMLKSSSEVVFSSFYYPNKHQREVRVEGDNLELSEEYMFGKYYIDSPFIITKDLSRKIRDFNYKKSHHQLAFEHWRNGGSFEAVPAKMPPEFDYREGFERTKRFLDMYFENAK